MASPRKASRSSQIAEQQFPGWKATKVSSLDEGAEPLESHFSDDATSNAAESVMPSQDELRKKYLGAKEAPPVAARRGGGPDTTADTDLVELESGPLKKTVAVSKRSRKVIWSQG